MAYELTIPGSGDHPYLNTLASGTVPNWVATDYTLLSCWFRTTGAVTGRAIVVQLVHARGGEGEENVYQLRIENDTGRNYLRWVSIKKDTTSTLEDTTGWADTDTSWHHVLAIANRDMNFLELNLDNGGWQSQACIKWPATAAWFVEIGAPGTFENTLQGEIAEVALWTSSLDDMAPMLSQGFRPFKVNPEGLIAYWPLVRELGSIYKEPYMLTAYNSPVAASDHPPIIG